VVDIIGTVESSPKGGTTLAPSRKPVVMPQNKPQYPAVIHQIMNKVVEGKMPTLALRRRRQPGRTNENSIPRTRKSTVPYFLIMR
jgi:hypothetical protein